MRLDPARHDASCGSRSVKLTPTEFRILARLGGRARRRCPPARARPLGLATRRDRPRQHARRVHREAARKLATLPGAPEIVTVHGVGYILR